MINLVKIFSGGYSLCSLKSKNGYDDTRHVIKQNKAKQSETKD